MFVRIAAVFEPDAAVEDVFAPSGAIPISGEF